ncbi:MAG: hypothetical protein M3332_15785 [Actinomycetota bacterium]|nr:hypothetical protein [Actinomycetota bacterium]
MTSTRAREYGQCTAALDTDYQTSGAEALYDQALSNGLVAIVEYEWPGEELETSRRRRRNKTKSATDLLKVIRNRATKVSQGIVQLTTRTVGYIDPQYQRKDALCVNLTAPSTEFVQVAVDLLQEAIDRTQSIRHGRIQVHATVGLDRRHIDALCNLNHHPALDSLAEEYGDQSWRAAKVQDLWTRNHAADYLEIIGEEEADRRMSTSEDYLPADPKDRAMGPELQRCPVCLRETLLADRFDSMGHGIGIGTCIVCSYNRGEAIAEDEASDIEWKVRWQDE